MRCKCTVEGRRVIELCRAHAEVVRNNIESERLRKAGAPIPLILTCPSCSARHIDEGEFATKPHHTHACQSCGMVWRPAIGATVGVRFLPGFKSEGT